MWFSFTDEGTVTVTLRAVEEDTPRRIQGRWWPEGDSLCVGVGAGTIQAPVEFEEEIIRWAGTVLARQPDLDAHSMKLADAPRTAEAEIRG